ncbi:P-loop containing nucleoside triphosphate hydrolase protein, partial [Roridomyces roridus]
LLHGLGGSGKTQIALTFIEEECSLFTDIFFIDASTQNTIEAGLSEIAVAKTSGRTPREALQWLRTTQEKWLLFFDNADDPKLNLNAFLPRGRHGNVLITSRNPGLSVYAGANHRVSDMEEEDAVPLLLTSAAQDDTPENQKIAGEIVKELSYLPLAIVQAGAFISRSGALESYLSLYHSNKARLLSEVPTQSHDDYAWTVYTTWHISFDRLSLTAATLLQLCSFLHHKGISEKLFSAAAAYQVKTYGPTKEEVEKTVEFLGRFKGSTGAWDSLQFMDVTNELRAYSLINYDAQTKTFSIHPLVHAWSQSILSQPATDKSCMTSIIGMQITALVPEEQDLAVILLPHIDALLPSHDVANLVVVPAFDLEYGVLYYYTGRFAQAEKLLLSALATRRTALGEDHFDTLVTMNHLATTYLHLGRWREAEGMQCIVVRKGTLMLGPDHPYVLVAAGSLAAIYTSLGRDSEALDLQVEITEKSKRILSEDDVNNVTAMGNLGVMLMNVGRLEEAEEMQLVVVEKRLKNRGGVHPDTLAAMSNLGMVYAKLGKLAKAEETQVVVLQRTRETEGEDSAGTLLAMNNLAVTYREMGRLDEAERELATVLRKRREFLGEEHPDTLSAMASLAWTYHMLGRFEEAKELGVVTVQKRRALLGDAHRDTIESMERLIKTLEKTGKL